MQNAECRMQNAEFETAVDALPGFIPHSASDLSI
jgi:hypothetical protein